MAAHSVLDELGLGLQIEGLRTRELFGYQSVLVFSRTIPSILVPLKYNAAPSRLCPFHLLQVWSGSVVIHVAFGKVCGPPATGVVYPQVIARLGPKVPDKGQHDTKSLAQAADTEPLLMARTSQFARLMVAPVGL